ncbi:MAG: alpha/beta hydrolase-fold protein [Phycisphaerae bacterium]
MNTESRNLQPQINRREFSERALLAAVAGPLAATAARSARAAAAWNQMPVSPIIHANRTVTFQFQDTHAKKVRVELGGIPPTPLRENAHGLWTITVGPLAPEIYSYAFTVDGVRILDPLNPWIKPNVFYPASMFLVPGNPPSLWQDCDVRHGVVHRHYYYSQVVGDNRDYYVYTPPGYNPLAPRHYPVLYLLHGYSDEASAWTKVGRANFILDNLLARRQAEPMIVVMPLGYGDMKIIARTGPGIFNNTLWRRNMNGFRAALLTEVMPRVQKAYNVHTDRDHTAIAGLSMGGGEALTVGLNNLNRFAWVGGMSSYLGTKGPDFSTIFPNLNKKVNGRLRLLWLACGQQDTLVGPANRNLDAWLTARKIDYTKVWTPGQHAWRVWRGNLCALAPLLFRTGG